VEPTLGGMIGRQKTMSPTKTIRRQLTAIRARQQPKPLLEQKKVPGSPLRSQRAPRVLHAITPSKMAGAETFLSRLMRRASQDQFVCHCVTSRSRANHELLAANLRFDRIGIGGKANVLAVPKLALAARRFQADLLHSHLSTASWWCGWLEQLGGPPSIGHVHGFTSAHWHQGQTHLIACSNAVRVDLIEKGISADRITVLHYPIDPKDLRPSRSRNDVRRELGANTDTSIVGTFAHLSPKKGHRELIQAAALVLNCLPKAQFWCFGDGALRGELEQTARELGIADRFKLFGFRRDVPDLMQAIDVMCLPSRREPFGLVYVEAALAGKPVIACRTGGAPEIITHGETGLLVPPPTASNSANTQISALADAIFTLLDNPATAAAMGQGGRESALSRFQWPSYIEQLRNVYDRVLS
jgi:glycosyltransferase involved in cell wall biosynthesis